MKRYVDIKDISDGNLYTSDSLVKINCNDCDGCSECCHKVGNSIILDPYDIWLLTTNLGTSMNDLMAAGQIELNVVDGVILPNIKISDEKKGCSFLNDEGMCSIHSLRPGFCRLFPLGRLYKDDGTGFDYFNQVYECPYPNKSKIKVKKWLGIPELNKYEDYILRWHNYLKELEAKIADTGDVAGEEARKINMDFIAKFFFVPYTSGDFYEQINSRFF